MITVRCKGQGGEVRFFGDDAETLDSVVANAASALRVFVSPERAVIETLKKRLQPAGSERGGEISLVASIAGGAEIEVRLPGRFSLDAALRGALKTAPGVLYLEDA
jgi:DNA polymerase-3 subunit alpha